MASFSVGLGSRSKNCRASSSAQMVMAAGSVMNDPSTGPTVRMVKAPRRWRTAAEAGDTAQRGFREADHRPRRGERHDHDHEQPDCSV